MRRISGENTNLRGLYQGTNALGAEDFLDLFAILYNGDIL